MLLLGILIGGPPSAFLLWGFGKPLISQHDRQHRTPVRPAPVGGLEGASFTLGTLVGFCFWVAVIAAPFWLVLR